MASVNTLCKSVLNVKNTVIKNCNPYSDKNGVKHIRIQARPNKWHENDCPFCHKSCPVYDKHSSRPAIWRGLDWGGILVEVEYQTHRIISIILIFVAINTSLHIGQDLSGKTVTNKIILGYDLKTIYNTQILIGILEALILFAIDTITIILASRIKSFSCDAHIFSFIVNLIIILISIIVISIFVTMLAIIIPSRILSLFIVIGVSLVLFQKGEDLSINLIEPAQTTFFNDSQEAPPMDNPLYIKGNQRTLYNLELLASPYAQIQYEKFILSEDHELKTSTSLILKHIPYHLEFIIVGFIECLIIYYLGQIVIKYRMK